MEPMPRLDEEYEQAFDRLLQHVWATPFRKEELTAFWPQIGADYQHGKGWLYVGQAPYGWGKASDSDPWFGARKRPDARKIREFSEYREPKQTGDPLDWARKQAKTSRFWQAVRWLEADYDAEWEGEWTRGLAWSNLFKIAPRERTNPSESLRILQARLCGELIQLEIKQLDPAAVIFLCGACWLGQLDLVETGQIADALYDGLKVIPIRTCEHPAVLAPHPRTALASGKKLDAFGRSILAALKRAGVA